MDNQDSLQASFKKYLQDLSYNQERQNELPKVIQAKQKEMDTINRLMASRISLSHTEVESLYRKEGELEYPQNGIGTN